MKILSVVQQAFSNLSIKRKLTLIIMLISSIALLMTSLAIVIYDQISFRQSLVSNLSILTEIIGDNSMAALTFNDQDAALDILSALSAEQHIVAACIYDENEKAFVRYFRDQTGNGIPDKPVASGYFFKEDHLSIFRPIVLDGKKIGTVFLQSDLRAMGERLRGYTGIVIIFLLASSLLAFSLSSKLQRVISKPLLHLVKVSQAVSDKKDYHVRAKIHSQDELGLLVKTFNEMLSQIQEQDAALRTSLGEKEVLLKEIHHRIKNNLQIISSLLVLQAGSASDEETVGMFKESQSRIRSMALIHEKLYQSPDLAKIDFAEYIHKLTKHLFQTYGANAKAVKLEINVKDIFLNIDSGVPCGLLINELISNSLKYAFPSGEKGLISIELLKKNDSEYNLIVKDTGVGLPQDFDLHKTHTLGLQLVNSLSRQLKGKMELGNNGGTEFRLTFSV